MIGESMSRLRYLQREIHPNKFTNLLLSSKRLTDRIAECLQKLGFVRYALRIRVEIDSERIEVGEFPNGAGRALDECGFPGVVRGHRRELAEGEAHREGVLHVEDMNQLPNERTDEETRDSPPEH